MTFKINRFKDSFIFYFKSKEARRFRIWGLIIILLSLGVYLFWSSEYSWIAALAILILFIPLYRKTLRSRTRWIRSEVNISNGTLIEKHAVSLGFLQTTTFTQTVRNIVGIDYYTKTEELNIKGSNELSSSDGFHTVISGCLLRNCYGPEFLKALEEITPITYIKKGHYKP